MDLSQCPVMKTEHQASHNVSNVTQPLNTENWINATERINDLQVTLNETTKKTDALGDALNTQQEVIEQTGNLTNELQQNLTALVELTEELQRVVREQRAQYGGLETKLGGLIMDVAQLKKTLHKVGSKEEQDTKNVLVQDPTASQCDGVQNGTRYKGRPHSKSV